MFKQQIMLSWRELSDHLGFSSRCILNIDSDPPNFERHQFWREISRDNFYSQARTSDMEHPTLRMFHKWLGYNLFYRDDIRNVRVGDLKLLYAAINKVPTSPVTLLVSHWLTVPSPQGPVGCTSLITRLASNLHLLENSSLEFVDELRIYHVSVFSPRGVTPTSEFVCVPPFPDGDAKRHTKIYPDSGKRRPYVQRGERVCIILHLCACTGVNTSVVWSKMEYESSSAYGCNVAWCLVCCVRSRASPFIVPRRNLGYKYRRQSRGR